MERISAPSDSQPPGERSTRLDLLAVGLLPMSLLALITGCVAGLGAVIFRALIGLIHNLLFLGQISLVYDARIFTPLDPWGPFVILVPVIGAVGVTWLVSNFAPEAKGHGVPEVMDAIYYHRGIIRPVVALIKSVASALAIGSGAAVGREGPIIQIGAAMGSTLGQLVRMTAGQRITLVAAGAGAGIAATFNTPLGGVLFASELLLPEISVSTFLPVAVATGAATFVGRLFFGSEPAFGVPSNLAAIPDVPGSVLTLLLYATLGVVAGGVSALYIYGLDWTGTVFDKIPGKYLRHCLGMFLLGCAMYALWRAAGHYYIEGVGYATIQAVLYNHIGSTWFLLLLCLAKLWATCLSLGSGSSGGIFSPSLFMGATLGAAFAELVSWFAPGAPVSVPAFAMVGMGAMVAGGTGAAVTAVTMIFEMTRDYYIVLPMILAVATALAVRQRLVSESIYTMKVARRGHPIPKALHTNLILVRKAGEVVDRTALVLDGKTPFSELLIHTGAQRELQQIVVTQGNRIIGTLRVDPTLRRAVGAGTSNIPLNHLAHREFIVVRETDAMFQVIARMSRRDVGTAIVVGRAQSGGSPIILGVISREQVASSVADSIQIYPEEAEGPDVSIEVIGREP